MSATTHTTALRELDHRHSSGIDVTLFWDERHGHLVVCVCDVRSGDYFSFHADGSEARAAFRHPYAYAARCGTDVSPAGRAPNPPQPAPARRP